MIGPTTLVPLGWVEPQRPIVTRQLPSTRWPPRTLRSAVLVSIVFSCQSPSRCFCLAIGPALRQGGQRGIFRPTCGPYLNDRKWEEKDDTTEGCCQQYGIVAKSRLHQLRIFPLPSPERNSRRPQVTDAWTTQPRALGLEPAPTGHRSWSATYASGPTRY